MNLRFWERQPAPISPPDFVETQVIVHDARPPAPPPADALVTQLRRESQMRAAASIAPPRATYRDSSLGPFQKGASRQGLLSFATLRKIYQRNSVIRMVVDTKVRQIIALEHEIQPAADAFVAPWTLSYARDLFAAPNPTDDSYEQWLKMLLTDFYVCDQLACEIAKTPEGWPGQLWPLDAATITPQYDGKRKLTGYTQTILDAMGSKKTIDFAPDEILYLQGNPVTWRSMSMAPLEALTLEVAGHLYAMKRNVDFFTDGFNQDVILFLEDVPQAEMDAIQAHFDEKYKGQADGIPMLGAKGTVQQLRQSNRDMQHMEWLHWLVQLACGVFQIDVSQVIMLQALQTKATGEYQQDIHASKSLAPDIAVLRRAFTQQVLRQIDPQAQFVFVEENKIDSQTEATVSATQLTAGVKTINEVRQEQGATPFVWPTIEGPDGDEVCVFDLPFVSAADVFGAPPPPFGDLTGGTPGVNPFTGQPFGAPPLDENGAAGDVARSLLLRARDGRRFRPAGPRPALSRGAPHDAHDAAGSPPGVAPPAPASV